MRTSLPSGPYSMSSSNSVSMWSEVKAMGTMQTSLLPFLARPLMASMV